MAKMVRSYLFVAMAFRRKRINKKRAPCARSAQGVLPVFYGCSPWSRHRGVDPPHRGSSGMRIAAGSYFCGRPEAVIRARCLIPLAAERMHGLQCDESARA